MILTYRLEQEIYEDIVNNSVPMTDICKKYHITKNHVQLIVGKEHKRKWEEVVKKYGSSKDIPLEEGLSWWIRKKYRSSIVRALRFKDMSTIGDLLEWEETAKIEDIFGIGPVYAKLLHEAIVHIKAYK